MTQFIETFKEHPFLAVVLILLVVVAALVGEEGENKKN